MRERRFIFTFAVALMIAALTGLLAACNPAETGDSNAKLGTLAHTRSVINTLVQKELDRGVTSISLAILKDGEVIWAEAFGLANLAHRAEANERTLYVSASTMKPVTSTALLQLIDQGKADLDDPINKYLGDLAITSDAEGKVTIRSILSHTSGLSDDEGQNLNLGSEVWDPNRKVFFTKEQIVAGLRVQEPVGEKWRYNNSAFALAGLLIERISGMPYEKYVVEHIFAQAGIDNRHPIFPTAAEVERLAIGYTRNENQNPVAGDFEYSGMYPAGYAYVTPTDMVRFLWIHLNDGVANGNRILSPELLAEAHEPVKEKYGLGWWSYADDKGHRRITHGGNATTGVTTMIGDKDSKIAVYAATNIAVTQATYRIADAALRLTRGEEVDTEDRKPAKVDPAKLKRFEGTYSEMEGVVGEGVGIPVTWTVEGSTLKARYEGSDNPMTYYPASETTFFEPNMGAEVTFDISDTGEVKGYSMIQHGWVEYPYAPRKE